MNLLNFDVLAATVSSVKTIATEAGKIVASVSGAPLGAGFDIGKEEVKKAVVPLGQRNEALSFLPKFVDYLLSPVLGNFKSALPFLFAVFVGVLIIGLLAFFSGVKFSSVSLPKEKFFKKVANHFWGIGGAGIFFLILARVGIIIFSLRLFFVVFIILASYFLFKLYRFYKEKLPAEIFKHEAEILKRSYLGRRKR